MNKKGELQWDELGTWIIVIIVGVIIILGILVFRDAIGSMLNTIKNMMRFGG